MDTPRAERDRKTRRRIGELADEWRRTASALPFWNIDDTGPELVLIGDDLGQPVATLHGMWAPNVARYVTAMNKHAGVALAELLWRIPSSTNNSDITRATLRLFQAMGLEEPTERHRPR
ncbi:hypothetical protein VA596_49955 [Amycolatopsis sp., V23-08]|uniref:Uncharacterized protein n=1 Tax=Amycolatopsis heterodermiae TaxID=3110235 RepID=A0ABU5RN36_9PSEU|nr:hypothetical protein [Amycolatopsis sp., V23-08]MEA5367736.1 hypothetical protein [Amycolatopsis sp., V23-08]